MKIQKWKMKLSRSFKKAKNNTNDKYTTNFYLNIKKLKI